MGTSGARISRRDVLDLAEALGVPWNGQDSMPALFAECVLFVRTERNLRAMKAEARAAESERTPSAATGASSRTRR